MQLPPLKAITSFEVVARLGSINRAADELHLTASAVSHQITNLEGFVGRKLFDRTSRGLVLTPVGERYRNDVTGALALIASAAHNARSSEGIEVLRIHVSPSFASLWLMPRLCGHFSPSIPTSGSSSPRHIHIPTLRAGKFASTSATARFDGAICTSKPSSKRRCCRWHALCCCSSHRFRAPSNC